jgi:cellulose synthase/poly-beta-1,6-N-acetylglucosamine synthase-like glycosyltransferase
MLTLGYVLVAIYLVALIFVTVFCLMQFQLLYHYMRKNKRDLVPAEIEGAALPFVTIQLPIFNERYVVTRLIENILAFDYPRDRYEVHILDDSTDDTLAISRDLVDKYKAEGYNIELITRPDRVGYKAGALKYATKYAKGDFIAIFDADFLPESDFLRRTIPHFANDKVGVVQTRWAHINQDYSLITELQAFQLNVHFTVEQRGREAGDYMLQFNGTAGVWRKETIESAGGWEADTLTEDLDLSYRAQIKGWEIVFLENVTSPAELPAEMNGLKSQQHRWMKGGAETAKKMLPSVWRSDLSLRRKVHATLHLLSSSVFLCVFIIGTFSVPILFLIAPLQLQTDLLGIFMVGLVSIGAVYFVANVNIAWPQDGYLKKVVKFILLFPIFLAMSMGLSLHNSIAVIQGFRGRKSAFVRTPKFDIKEQKDSFVKSQYRDTKINKITMAEGLLALYFIGGIVAGLMIGEQTFLLFHILLTIGYGTTFYYSVKHARARS